MEPHAAQAPALRERNHNFRHAAENGLPEIEIISGKDAKRLEPLGMESPVLTASLAIAKHIVDLIH
jgi:L-2-hydroxyglutarate oxidase LhgO